MNKRRHEFGFLVPGQERESSIQFTEQEEAELPDFSRMTKQQRKAFDDVEGSYKRLLNGQPITWFWLLNHYSKPNAAAYKAQKARAKEEKLRRKGRYPVMPPAREEVEIPFEESPVDWGGYQTEQKQEQEKNFDGGTILIDRSRLEPSDYHPKAFLDCLAFGQTVEITKIPYRIGRADQGVELCISDNPAVSSIHAEITYEAENFYITDLHSLNRVYLNDAVIPQGMAVVLRNNTKIMLGNEAFLFHF